MRRGKASEGKTEKAAQAEDARAAHKDAGAAHKDAGAAHPDAVKTKATLVIFCA